MVRRVGRERESLNRVHVVDDTAGDAARFLLGTCTYLRQTSVKPRRIYKTTSNKVHFSRPRRLLKLHAVMDDRLVVHFRKRRPSVLASDGEPVIGLLLALGTVEGLASSGKG